MVRWTSWFVEATCAFTVVFLHGLSLSYSHPDIYHVRPKNGNRAIQPYSCHDPTTKEEGVCMFSWNCQRSNGTHLTYCMDRFYFGSCCRLPPGVYIATPPSIASNEVTETQKVKHRPSDHHTTTESTPQQWSSDEKKYTSATRVTNRPTKVTQNEFPPGLVTWRPNSEASSTRSPVKKKPTKLFSNKPLFASSTEEPKTTDITYSSTTLKTYKPTTERHYKPTTEIPYTTERSNKPSTERPNKPSTERPNKPSTERPNKPSTERPNKPSTERPNKPFTEKPNKPSTERPNKPSTERPYKFSSFDSTIKTKPTTPQRSSTSATSVSRRRTRPTRPNGSTYPKRRTRPTRPYAVRNSTASRVTQRKTKPTLPTSYRPTTPASTPIVERTTSKITIGTWSNILDSSTRPLPFIKKPSSPAPTRLTFKTTSDPTGITFKTTPDPTRLTFKTTSVPTRLTFKTTSVPTRLTFKTTSDPVLSSTKRTTVQTTVTQRRAKPTRPHVVKTSVSPSTTVRTTPKTRKPFTTKRTTHKPITESTYEIITFPPFPGVIRKTTRGPSTISSVSETRRTTTIRPETSTRLTTVTVSLPSTAGVSMNTPTTTTTEAPTTTEKITPGQDYTKDITVTQTSTSGDILLTTLPSDEIASSTLNPDIELTTPKGEDTTAQWFTMTSDTKHNTLGRNPIVPDRPVQILYDENGHEILLQEEVEVASVPSSGHSRSSTVPMNSVSKEQPMTEKENGVTHTGTSTQNGTSTKVLTSTGQYETLSEVLTSSEKSVSMNGVRGETDNFSFLKGSTDKFPVTEPESTSEVTKSISIERDRGETNIFSFLKGSTSKSPVIQPESTLEMMSSPKPTDSVEISESVSATFENTHSTTTKKHYTTHSTTTEKGSTVIVSSPHLKNKNKISTLGIQDYPTTSSHSVNPTAYVSEYSGSYSTASKRKTQIHKVTLTSSIKHKTQTDATIHGEHLMEDYLYGNYDYYDDLYEEGYLPSIESTTNKDSDLYHETVNNHKVTFSPLGTFDALVQEKTQTFNDLNHDSAPAQSETSQLPYVSTSSSVAGSHKNGIKPFFPTVPHEGNIRTKPTQTITVKPPQKPFLPSIPHEENQVGKVPVQGIKKPQQPSYISGATNPISKTTTQVSMADEPEFTVFTDSSSEGIKTTVVTIDNHRPPFVTTQDSVSFHPIKTSTSNADDETEDKIASTETVLLFDKLSTVILKPTHSSIITTEEKTAYETNSEIMGNTIIDVDKTNPTRFTNRPGVKYPFPTILMQHTTKGAMASETPNAIQSTFGENIGDTNTQYSSSVTAGGSVSSTFSNDETESANVSLLEENGENTIDYASSLFDKTEFNDSDNTNPDKTTVSLVKDQTTQLFESTSTKSHHNQTSSGPTNSGEETTTPKLTVLSTTVTPDFIDTTISNTTTTTMSVSTATEIDLSTADYKEVCGKPKPGPVGRVVGGGNSYFGEWPWVVSLRQWKKNAFLHKCGATLLNEFWAITAAHCVENVPLADILLRLGEYDISHENEPLPFVERRVQIVASHPQFDRRTFEYDLALLRFYEPITFQRNILPVCIPSGNNTYVGKYATVTGWGRLYEDGPLPDVIQEVSLPIITNKLCENMYRQAGFVEDIPDIFICAGYADGGKDSCEGDSGGPMVLQEDDGRWVLAGVISWGIGCALPNQPGVYTRITKFAEWINQIIIF